MGKVTDVRAADGDPPVLTELATDGLLGGQLLNEEPLAAHLGPQEEPRFVLRNKSWGLDFGQSYAGRTVAPADDCRALAAVTNANVHFVIGRQESDERHTVALADVASATVDDGLLDSTLRIVTDDDFHYEFRCRGDVGAVADYVDATAQAWSRAYRLLDDARTSLEAAEARVDDDRFDAALGAVDDADEALTTARERLADLGEGPAAVFEGDAAPVRERARQTPRWIFAERARTAHAAARDQWADEEYEAAYDEYDAAVAAYERARSADGSDPPGRALEVRYEQAIDERASLETAPVEDAEAAARMARATEDPIPAAARWETAIERYRTALWLDWGRETSRFDVDRDAVREDVVAAVDEYVDYRRRAAAACRETGRAHRHGGNGGAAARAYDTALAHLKRAQEIVDEIAPAKAPDLDGTVETISWEREAVLSQSDEQRGFQRGAGD